ncbi:baculoviral IAP repeat-containing protein 2-like isoform X2 [Trichosurus vulpecula]|uniref:baculoviral IAP repeat-containing protein 2-like isoform X2 n=1 Tax=Trichosurus vulpecula TaxID=9337 RepID=UPI00186B500C|nr:baculoviral IAP repeat-containing protein 2-like isoform X2 [Trichosurus vulpecula]
MHKTTSPEKDLSHFCPLNLMNVIEDSNLYELKYDFSCELYRMSTYSAFPVNVPISERSLARAGFYYTGVNDRVKCFCCGLMLDNWKQGDSAIDKHKQLYPSCAFIQNLIVVNNLESSSQSAFSFSGMNNVTCSLSPSSEQSGYFSGSYSSFPLEPVTSRVVEDLSPLNTSPYSYSMSTEDARILTYQTWPLTFMSPLDLAKAGFYYIGPGDMVACFACGGKLSNWEPKDDAMSEHRRHFPNCPFLGNQIQETSRFSVSNLSMQSHAARMKTFVTWPSQIPVPPEQLASAGFYYMGCDDDVKCFCCDGGLRCWESGDDPWVEHAKWFPRCEYLIAMKGQQFINQIQASYPHLLAQLLSTSDTPVDESAELPRENHSEDAIMMNTSVVKAALEMGFNRRLIKQTVQSKILTTGENYKTVSDLVSDLLKADDETREEEKEQQTEETESVEKNIKYIPAADVSDLSIEEQLRRLQEERTCKVCMDKEVSVVFIPCGHLVVCKECAPSLRKCPICRSTIKGTVRTFLS